MEIIHTCINSRYGKLQDFWITALAGKYDDYGHQEEGFLQPNRSNKEEHIYSIRHSLWKPPLIPPSTNTTWILVKYSSLI